MFIGLGRQILPSSVGATSVICRSYGAWKLLRNMFYKHSAPLALGDQSVCQQYQSSPLSIRFAISVTAVHPIENRSRLRKQVHRGGAADR